MKTKKTYPTKISPKVKRLISTLSKKLKINIHLLSRKDFVMSAEQAPPVLGGFFFEGSDRELYLFINDRQIFKDGHDLIALHELGHALYHKLDLGEHEEIMACGFAIAMAKILNIPIKGPVLKRFKEYQ